ncbi:MAG TPA: M20/M25/M40 family metallo-hydrolase, partial [Longimicrobiales bacterium]|nr:M20/M25/M40 family metallo-hydrolase [Longimicrobiales bacterium]
RTIRPGGPVGRRARPRLLAELGAGAALVPSQGAHGTIFVLGNRNTPDDAAPTVVLEGEHYNRLVRMVQDGLPVRVRVGVDVRYHEEDPSSYNVLAEIPGSDPDIGGEVVMVGAHLDSWHSATAATDNADGAAAVLEAARILSALGVRPRRTIRFALWGGEEEGLLGSRAWVERHLAGPENREARDRFSVYFNQDIGGGGIYGVYLQGNEAATPILDAWVEALRDVGTRRNVHASIGSSDHMSFEALGLPGFSTVQDYTDYDTRTHHTNQDFYERLTEEGLRRSAVVLASLLYQAAERDRRFPRKPAAGGG